MMNIKGAIFDMDGTLIDSLMVWDVLWNEFGELFCDGKVFVPTEDDNKAIRTMTLEQAMNYLHSVYGIGKCGEELLGIANKRMENFYANEVQLKEGVLEFLNYCHKKGISMCIASATSKKLLDIAIKHCNIEKYFTNVLSCAEIGKGKDEPDIYLMALNLLGTNKEETVVFEDSLVAIKTADKIGMNTVGIFDKYNYGQSEIEKISSVYISEGETLEKLIVDINIVSFNIRAHNDGVINSIEKRAPRLASVIEPYEPDIIGFQESAPTWEPYLEEYFGDTYDMFNKYRCETTDMESCPILWRKDKFECIDTGYFWFSDTPEEESKGWDEVYDCYRMCEYVILKAKETNTKFVVMNAHLGFGDDGQVKSVELIYEYSKKISKYPTIVLGDFNMTPDTPAYERMTELFTDVNAVTAQDWSQTYHGYKPEEYTEEHVDYCFVNQKVTPINQEIIDDLVEGEYPSDHYGLNIDVQF